MIELRLLGGIELRGQDRTEVRSVLTQPKRLALLAYLAAAESRPYHRRDTLLALFWPALDQTHARGALNRAVYQIRCSLGQGVLVSRGDDELGVNRDRLRCDVAAFREALERGRLEEALELYRGELLEGFFVSGEQEFESWLELERSRLRRLAADAAWRLAEATAGPAEIIRAADRAMALSGDNEEATRRYLILLDRAGDRAGALRAYAAFVSRMKEEFGAEPSPQTVALMERVRTGENRSTVPIEAAFPLERGVGLAHRTSDAHLPALPGGATVVPNDPDRYRALAVLPFSNLSGDPATEFMSDGFTEEIIGRLAYLSGLRVISRTSVMQYKGIPRNLREIAGELGVANILEGSVRIWGDRLRITARLIEAATDTQLWGRTYDREMADIFEVQSDVAHSIAAALQAEATEYEATRIVMAPTRDLAAYELYLKGRYLWNRLSPEVLRSAIAYFEQAIERDPGYAQSYAGLADAYIILPMIAPCAPRAAGPKALDAARKALELDPALAEAHAAFGEISVNYDWNWARGERHFRKAIDLNANSASARVYHAAYLAKRGRFGPAIAEMDTARTLDPFSVRINALAALMRYYARRYDDALEGFRYALELDPNSDLTHFLLSKVYTEKGMYREAVAAARTAVEFGGRSPARLGQLGASLAFAGRRDAALAVLRELERRAREEYVNPGYSALIHTGLGETDAAIAWLQKGFDDRDYWMLFLKADPMLDRLRSDARFAELVSRVGM